MAIDVKAEAERISRAYIYSKFSYGGDVSGHRKDLHDEILQFADSVRDEAIRETVEHIERLLMMNSCGCLHAIRAAFAATEPKIVHGLTCNKAPHTRDGYLHGEDYDGPYDVDGLEYCGRCHVVMPSPTTEPRDVAKDDPRQRFDQAALALARDYHKFNDDGSAVCCCRGCALRRLYPMIAARELGLDGAA